MAYVEVVPWQMTGIETAAATGGVLACLPGAGEMARRIRAFDWTRSDLGPPDRWPENLRVALGLCLSSRFPTQIWWGARRTLFYNDAFAGFLGAADHPRSFGRPASEHRSESWQLVAPAVEAVFRTGAASSSDDAPLFLARAVAREEAYATLSHDPILATDGRTVDGVFCTCSETTERVVARRRLEALRRLTPPPGSIATVDAACDFAVRAIGEAPRDIPFAAVYLMDEGGARATLRALTPAGEHGLPAAVTASDEASPLHRVVARVLTTGQTAGSPELEEAGLHLPGGPWPEPAARAIALPLAGGGDDPLPGVLMVGVSPRRPRDAAYQSFLELVAGQVAAAVAVGRHAELVASLRDGRAHRRPAGGGERGEVPSRDELALELRAMARLHELSTRLLERTELGAVMNEVLDAIMSLQGAEMGFIELCGGAARIAAHRGFAPEVLERHGAALSVAARAGALRSHARAMVIDVRDDPAFAELGAAAGFRAVQCTAIRSRGGETLGVLSICFRHPHRTPDRDLRMVDLYALQAAEAIERSRATEALRASEERFRQVFELGRVGMAIISPAHGVMEVNQELCRMLGCSREQLSARCWSDMAHPDDRAVNLARVEEVLAGRLDGYSLETRWYRTSGELIHTIVSASCVRSAGGAVEYLVGLVQDITARKQAEEELRRTAADLAEAQRLSHTGSWSWRVVTGENVWSEELYRIFGVSPAETPPSKAPARQVHRDDAPRVRRAVASAIRAREPFDLQYRIRLRDDTVKHLRVLGRPVAKEGESLEYTGVVMDITEEKRREAAVDHAHAELERVTRQMAIGEVAAAIAHEINQPLGAIVNNASVCLRLLDATPPPEDAREVMQNIVEDAQRASSIVQHIRALTRTGSLERTWFGVDELIRDVLRLAERQLADGRVVVNVRISEGLPPLLGARVQIQQLLLNLVLNAVEAMLSIDDTRRVLTIDAQPSALDAAPAISICVTDVGAGFDPREAERLFEPFHTTKRKGMGMGLRIGRSIAEAHGGRLIAMSNPGAGATFQCLLPLDD